MDIAQGSLGGWLAPLPVWLGMPGDDAVQGVKPGVAEVGFSDVPDVQPPSGVAGVLADEELPGALRDELGVHGDAVLGEPENFPSDSTSLLTGLIIP